MARVVTVEELEALAEKIDAVRAIADDVYKGTADYDTEDTLGDIITWLDNIQGLALKCAEQRRRVIASARTDAEADKADAKRKDV